MSTNFETRSEGDFEAQGRVDVPSAYSSLPPFLQRSSQGIQNEFAVSTAGHLSRLG